MIMNMGLIEFAFSHWLTAGRAKAMREDFQNWLFGSVVQKPLLDTTPNKTERLGTTILRVSELALEG